MAKLKANTNWWEDAYNETWVGGAYGVNFNERNHYKKEWWIKKHPYKRQDWRALKKTAID